MGANKPAIECADDLLNTFWPDPDQSGDSARTVVTRGQLKQLLTMAHHTGQAYVISKTVDDLHKIQWDQTERGVDHFPGNTVLVTEQ